MDYCALAALIARTRVSQLLKDRNMAFASTSDYSTSQKSGFSAAGFFSKLNGILTTLQVARMSSVLASMPDEQLRQIGITRNEIVDYAEKLILNKAPK